VNTLPPSLVRFESQLERAIQRQRARRRRQVALRLAAVGAAGVAVWLGVLSVLPGGGGPSAVARAEAALSPSGGTILHTVVVTTRAHTDGSTVCFQPTSSLTCTGTIETWQLNSPPYDQRYVQSVQDGLGRELATADGLAQYYDARTNTIYTVAPDAGPRAQQAAPPREGVQRLLDNLRELLASGEAREDGRVEVDGRDAIRIVFRPRDGRDRALFGGSTLVVDAATYEPIEFISISDDGWRITERFRTYALLPATEENMALLSLTEQHPDAAIDASVKLEGVTPGKEPEGPELTEGESKG
jgi:hypothetical protein